MHFDFVSRSVEYRRFRSRQLKMKATSAFSWYADPNFYSYHSLDIASNILILSVFVLKDKAKISEVFLKHKSSDASHTDLVTLEGLPAILSALRIDSGDEHVKSFIEEREGSGKISIFRFS